MARPKKRTLAAVLVAAAAVIAIAVLVLRQGPARSTARNSPSANELRPTPRASGFADPHFPVPERTSGADVAADALPAGGDPEAACESSCETACTKSSAGPPVCPKTCTRNDNCSNDEVCHTTDRKNGGRVRRCLKSECLEPGPDNGCGPGRQCQFFGSPEGGIFLCKDTGTRVLGQSCVDNARLQGERCQAGLHCTPGGCLPLECNDRNDCQLPGTMCVKADSVEPVSVCVPKCFSDADCGSGHRCGKLESGFSQCLPENEIGCTVDGCAAGESCVVFSSSPDGARAACYAECSVSGDGSCPAGLLCADLLPVRSPYCVLPCQEDSDCAKPQTCAEVQVGTEWRRACTMIPEGITDLREYFRRFVVENESPQGKEDQ